MTQLPAIGEDDAERAMLRRAVQLHDVLRGAPPDRETLTGYARQLRGGASLDALAGGLADPAAIDDAAARYRARLGAPAVPAAAAGDSVERLVRVIEADPSVARVRLLPILFPGGTSPGHGIHYRWWLEENQTLNDAARMRIRDRIATLPTRPRLSFLVLAREANDDLLATTLRSLSQQLYPDVEILVLSAGQPNHARANVSPAVRFVDARGPNTVAGLFNAGLQAATGDVLGIVAAGDFLFETAAFEAASAISAQPDLRLLYSDEDFIHADGRRHSPVLKTDWDADAMLAQDQVGRLALFNRTLTLELGGMRDEAGPWAEYDLTLRTARAVVPQQIRHLLAVLYHRRTRRTPWWSRVRAAVARGDPSSDRQRAAIVREQLSALGHVGGQVMHGGPGRPLRITYPLPADLPVVSIIVPTKDRLDLLRPCLDGLLHKTDYPALDIIVVDNDSREPATRAYFASLQDPRVRVVPDPGPFNWAAINNRAVELTRGDIVVLLNNDIEIIEAGWLREMVSHVLRPEVGVVGAKLLFPDSRIQHAGIAVGSDYGPTAHPWMNAAADEPGYLNCLSIVHNATAVTGACLALRKAVFRELGGFDAVNLAVAGNDPDLCLRARAFGYRVIWTPHACLIHAESATRGRDEGVRAARLMREQAHLRATWGAAVEHDAFFNPNISRFAPTPLIRPRSPIAGPGAGA